MTEPPAGPASELGWSGIFPVVPTPFNRDGEFVLASYQTHIERLIGAGVHGLIALGTAGEGPSMTPDEWLAVAEAAAEAASSRVPVLAGVGGTNEAAILRSLPRLAQRGITGLLLATPPLYPLTQNELLAYVRRIASASELPVMLYNSTYTGMPLTPGMLEELASDLPNFVALKEGNQVQASDVIRRLRGRVAVFTSRDLHIHELLAVGGAGAIAFTANLVPELVPLQARSRRATRSGPGAAGCTQPACLGGGDTQLPGRAQGRHGPDGLIRRLRPAAAV
jgi:4-hydroxy-tetrahydrodipicolinate synthase